MTFAPQLCYRKKLYIPSKKLLVYPQVNKLGTLKKQMTFLMLSLFSLSDILAKRVNNFTYHMGPTLSNIPPKADVNPFLVADASSATKIVKKFHAIFQSNLLCALIILCSIVKQSFR